MKRHEAAIQCAGIAAGRPTGRARLGFCAAVLVMSACEPTGLIGPAGPPTCDDSELPCSDGAGGMTAGPVTVPPCLALGETQLTPDAYVASTKPSDTPSATGGTIGSDQWNDDSPTGLGDLGLDHPHFFVRPAIPFDDSLLLVVLGGGGGTAPNPADTTLYELAAGKLGYHVIGLTYPAGHTNSCGDTLPAIEDELTDDDKLHCFGDMLMTTITGACPHPLSDPNLYAGCRRTNVYLHPQDSLEKRLGSALTWLIEKGRSCLDSSTGWEKYLKDDGTPDWSLIRLVGESGGASHAAQMGLYHSEISRVVLLASPNDGIGDRDAWRPASYLVDTLANKDRFFGLVHIWNQATSPSIDTRPLFKSTVDWLAMGMGQFGPPPTCSTVLTAPEVANPNGVEPLEPSPYCFDPHLEPGDSSFGAAHILVSADPATTTAEAHTSVLEGRYDNPNCEADPSDPDGCPICDGPAHCEDPANPTCGCDPTLPAIGESIEYEPAWSYMLGNGSQELPPSN
jgi:hypothetical protein